MVNIKTFLSSYVTQRPVTTGLFAVLAVVTIGIGIGVTTGFATPLKAFADPIIPITVTPIVVTPVVEVPVTPIIPIVPIVVTPVVNPVITTPIITTPVVTTPGDGGDPGDDLSPCCTVTTPDITAPVITTPDITTPDVSPDAGDDLTPCCTVTPITTPITLPITTPVTPVVVPPVPQCSLSASPNSITRGDSSTLSWTTTNGTSFSVTSIGNVSSVDAGNKSVSPTTSTTYEGTVTGPGGQANCDTTVTVTSPPVIPPAPTCSLQVTPSIIHTGDNTTIVWNTTNATSFTLDHGIGAEAQVGGSAITVTPNGTTTYTGTAVGSGGTITCSATVTVVAPVVTPPAPTCSLVANPTSIEIGSASVLSWTTTNATSFSINGTNETPVANGSVSVSPLLNTTYTGTATGPGGTITCPATVTVTIIPVTPAPSCTLVANPTTIQQGGSATLSWTTSNANTFVIDQHVGQVAPTAAGSTSVSPTQTTTYTGTATGPGGTFNCSATVIVTNTPTPAPTCSLNANTSSIELGSAAVLIWNTTNATSFVIDNHVGSVLPIAAGSTSVTPWLTTTYTGTATGAGGTITCSTTVTVTIIPTPGPSCTLVANPTTIQQGSSSTLSWTTSNADTFVIDQHIGAVAPVAGGSTGVAPAQTTTYTGTATGAGGTINCSATVIVTNTPTPPAPTCTLVANPTSVQFGSGSVLSWTTTNATSLVINRTAETPVAAGSISVTPLLTTNYVATATGPGGTVTCPATVTVTLLPPPPPAPSCTLTANPTSITQTGGRGVAATLSWVTANATTFSIDNNIGSVTPVADGSTNVSPTTTTTYTGTATGPNGTVNCSATITVTTPPPPAPTCTLTANPTSVVQGGSSALSWTTSNATSFTIDQGLGSVTPVGAGSTNVTPANTTTYTGTATGSGGTVTCQATVTVTTPGGGPTPSCTLTASPTVVNQGGSATLSWGGTDIQSVSIDNGVGNESASGSTNVSPSNTTTYTGTFLATTGQTLTCQATVTVNPPAICTSGCGGGGISGQFIFYHGQSGPPILPTAYVALSQIPYTGLDLGPIGTVVYWIALILICLGLAYLIIFNLIPFIYGKLQSFGTDVSHAINQPANGLAFANGAGGAIVAPAGYAAASSMSSHPVSAPVAASVAAPASKSAYSMNQGFRSFAEGNTLTIDDIVKGLAREAAAPVAVATAPVVAHYETMPAPKSPSTQPVSAYAEAPARSTERAAPVPTDIRDFVAALLNGDRTTVFTTLRQVVREGGDAEAFITQVVCAIDDAYRARLDGTSVHPEIAQLTQHCATPFLERLNNALTNAVDSSYSPGISGSKLALTRALAVVEG